MLMGNKTFQTTSTRKTFISLDFDAKFVILIFELITILMLTNEFYLGQNAHFKNQVMTSKLSTASRRFIINFALPIA